MEFLHCHEEEIEFYKTTFGVSEPWNIPTDKLEDCDYKDLRLLDDKFKEMESEIEELKKENSELKFNGGFCGDYETSPCANAMTARFKDQLIKDLKSELDMINRIHEMRD
jgi:hypothetical protein